MAQLVEEMKGKRQRQPYRHAVCDRIATMKKQNNISKKGSHSAGSSQQKGAQATSRKHTNRKVDARKQDVRKAGTRKQGTRNQRTNAQGHVRGDNHIRGGNHGQRGRERSGLYCPIDSRCGGCENLKIAYKVQLAHKQETINELFEGLFDKNTQVDPICGMADPRYYRNKVVSPYVGIYDKRARERKIICGMYERGTHWVIDSNQCLIENQLAKAIILTVRDLMPSFGLSPYDEKTNTGFLRHVMVRVGHNSGEVMVTLVTRTEKFPSSKHFVRELKRRHPEITTVVQNINPRQTNVILGEEERTLYGPGFILDTLCGLSFRISSQSFYQVNATQTEVLYTRAIEMAQLTGTETVIDAYCGTGTIGLVAARGVSGHPGAKRVIGVEERVDAVADARNNARHNGVEAAEFVAGDAGAFMREHAGEIRADVLLMDPPRSGATPDFLKAACLMSPRRIVYISCDPRTQVRDTRYFLEHGYRIDEVQPVDMFPHTNHIENIIAFVKKDK